MADSQIDIDVELSAQAIQNLLIANPSFITAVRLALSSNVRGTGNTLSTWADRKPRPKTTNPNTPQRVW